MGTVLLLVILSPLIISAAVVCVTFLLSWWVFPGGGSRGPHDTFTSRVIGVIVVVFLEWLSTSWVLYTLPFYWVRVGGPRRRLQAGRVPVVILTGFFESPLTMLLLRSRLEHALGVPVRVLRPKNYFAGLQTQAADYREQIEEFCEETSAKQVDLVGHSMGGLIARYLIERSGYLDRIRTIITIGTPHLGSALCRLAPGRSLRQMRRGSAFLEELNSGSTLQEVRVIGICSTHDNLVIPWNCALSPRGDNFIIRYQGHVTLILSGEVARIVIRELRSV
ncbi:MAG: alpha/beta fold hydrolase [Deltaproteobacteria bacterium]|nr:alpha/beta fold hydrolase [Deltaproteobacteria bacterium]MBW1871466.1 alpha/beta fold hydrolase [Deltaproteobacteria bacterium]